MLAGDGPALELGIGTGSEREDHVKVAVFIGSLLAATLATVVLRIRNGVYRRIEEIETADDDTDGMPTSTALRDPHHGDRHADVRQAQPLGCAGGPRIGRRVQRGT